MDWLTHLIAIVALSVACGVWVLLQRWIAKRAPDLPGVGRRCADCTCDGDEGRCRNADELQHDEPR